MSRRETNSDSLFHSNNLKNLEYSDAQHIYGNHSTRNSFQRASSCTDPKGYFENWDQLYPKSKVELLFSLVLFISINAGYRSYQLHELCSLV